MSMGNAAAVCMYADELVIENLRPETQYHFFVQAKNDVGVGPRQEIRAITTAISQ